MTHWLRWHLRARWISFYHSRTDSQLNGVDLSKYRVLVVTPNFPPANGADMHRVRATIPFFADHGWSAEVLTVDPKCLAAPQDHWLTAGIPESIPIHRSKALSLRWSSVPGLGTINLRGRLGMSRLGSSVLGSKRFDLVYFSTTAFSLTALGSRWKRRFGVPFVVDYQDPWVTDYYRDNRGARPPGGRLKYAAVDHMARWREPRVLANCSGITAVSEAYLQQLRERYAFALDLPSFVAPFPGARRDFQRLVTDRVTQSHFDAMDGYQHWVYVGVSGSVMEKSLRAFFHALANAMATNASGLQRLKIHFIGTSYAPAGTGVPTVRPLANEYGVEDMVYEQTDRIPFSEALRCLLDADALLVPGSNDSAYNASKLLPYLLAGKPMLAVFHDNSPVRKLLDALGGATLVTFQDRDSEGDIAARIRDAWFGGEPRLPVSRVAPSGAGLYTDSGQAKLLCEFFERVVQREKTPR